MVCETTYRAVVGLGNLLGFPLGLQLNNAVIHLIIHQSENLLYFLCSGFNFLQKWITHNAVLQNKKKLGFISVFPNLMAANQRSNYIFSLGFDSAHLECPQCCITKMNEDWGFFLLCSIFYSWSNDIFIFRIQSRTIWVPTSLYITNNRHF